MLEEGHCLRDQALAFCSTAKLDMPLNLGATSLATIMQMVANGYGVTLLPQVAVDAEARDERIKLLRFVAPEPSRTIGLAWRRTSPRKDDFVALAQLVAEVSARRANPTQIGESGSEFAGLEGLEALQKLNLGERRSPGSPANARFLQHSVGIPVRVHDASALKEHVPHDPHRHQPRRL